MNQFFEYTTFQDFLRDRYERLKATRPNFSARAFAKKAGIKSPSFFQMISTGKRKLTIETAERFSTALGLSSFEKECLLTACAFDRAKDAKSKQRLLEKLAKLQRQVAPSTAMNRRHVEILSDPINLKLYLLGQSSAFKSSANWLRKNLPDTLSTKDVEQRIGFLLDSGLWIKSGDSIKTMAPSINSRDAVHNLELIKTHQNLLEEAKRSITNATAEERIATGQTFLFDPKRLPEIKARIDAFKSELESDFECIDSTHAFHIQLAFFELGRTK